VNSQEFVIRKGGSWVIYDANLAEKKPLLKNKRRLGYLFLNLSLTTLLLFLTPILLGELSYWHRQVSSPEFLPAEAENNKIGFGELLSLEKEGFLSPADWDFTLLIPSIKLNAKVIPSVSPENANEYEKALKSGVAHAQGTSLPNQPGTVYLFGHSTDYPWNIAHYNALFYSLRYLDEGDEVILIYQNSNYLYQVTEKKVVDAQDLEYLYSQDERQRLVLQTCWPPGTSWKRLIIIAEPLKKA
jgi:LPXTG-site transpeptidase (sortase) family protein